MSPIREVILSTRAMNNVSDETFFNHVPDKYVVYDLEIFLKYMQHVSKKS